MVKDNKIYQVKETTFNERISKQLKYDNMKHNKLYTIKYGIHNRSNVNIIRSGHRMGDIWNNCYNMALPKF